MTDAVGIARLVLVAVVAVAGWAKLSDRNGTRQAVREFGVPEALARPFTFLLPLAELTVAGLLLFSGSAVLGAIGAAALLGLFIVAIAVSLARGRRPDCHCFGQVHSEPVGPATLVRNAVLVGLAAFVIADGRGGTNVWDWFADLTATGWLAVAAAVVVAIALGVLAWLVVNLIAQQGRLLNRIDTLETALGIEPEAGGVPAAGLPVGADAIRNLVPQAASGQLPAQRWIPVGLNGGQGHVHAQEPAGPPPGPPIGEPAPSISLPDLEGSTVSLAGLRGQPTMVLFWNPG